MTYRDKLKKAMQNQRINARQLSELTGISNQSLSGYLNGKNVPTVGNKRKLDIALGCKIEEIEDDMSEVVTDVETAESMAVEFSTIKSSAVEPSAAPSEPKLLNAAEAAKMVGMCAETLRTIAKTGRFAWAIATGNGKRTQYIFHSVGLYRWYKLGM
jgi:transcriptional regulator with XRE-family HTH domain